jgi:NADH-quinone oxidoreductase subunit F
MSPTLSPTLCTLRTLIEDIGGGSSTGRPLRAAVVGGPSGSVVHPRHFDEPLVPRGPVNPGTGGVIALDEQASVRDVVRTLLAFNTRESCGKCTPCREGTARLLAMLDGPLDVSAVKPLAEVIQLASLCGLGQAAPYAVLSGLTEFPEEFTRAAGSHAWSGGRDVAGRPRGEQAFATLWWTPRYGACSSTCSFASVRQRPQALTWV